MQDLQEQVRLLREIRLALQENDFARAIGYLERIVEIAKERGDLSAAARHLGNLALTYYRAGQPDPALANFEEALVCAREENDRLTENGLLGNMGNILRELGRYDEAMRYLNEALLIAQEVGDKRGRGIWLTNLGLVHDDLEQPGVAFDMHQQAADIARQLFDQPNVALRLGHMGNSKVALGHYDASLQYFSEAADIYDNDAAYRQSKQANRMLSVAFAELFEKDNINVNSCHPGDVNSKLSNNLGFGGHQSPESAAETAVWLAKNSHMNASGKYFENKTEVRCGFSQDKKAIDDLYRFCLQYV